ncbi:uncharacterized protein LOC9656104 [Selaginella moellendorffii]|uniref:uncharacterized protein LOC9656104 n=1 Tax=Selaginella moellendorffii TaxID=88036 RepID=UPI000D1C7596|nr:uncharacterized protein LOC9656104 [Selaginella moellendorffii]|eukprot:XP_024538186.1 uncharacterized protein LOC9656104 [Selaginella moellendorffii]
MRFIRLFSCECSRFSCASPMWRMSRRIRSFASSASLDGHSDSRKKKKRRLDELCVERYPQFARNVVQSWIIQGKVFVDGRPGTKSGMQVAETSAIEITAQPPKYVCRAGDKLAAALERFGCDLNGKVVLDSGLSTGGFTDCMLQHGATRVYGVDVGYGQVAEKIRTDKRVRVMERTNLRLLTRLPEMVDFVTLDLCFISVLLVMPAVCSVMKQDASGVILIKPQFEAARSQVGGGGIVRKPEVHREVLEKVIDGVEEFGFACKGWMESPIKGTDGNTEFLAYFHRMTKQTPAQEKREFVANKSKSYYLDLLERKGS